MNADAPHLYHYQTWDSNHLTILGLESASELGSFSESACSRDESAHNSEDDKTSLLGLDARTPWNASLVVSNIERVPYQSSQEELDKLLTIADHLEQQLTSQFEKADLQSIAQHSEQLYALYDLVGKMQIRLNLHPAEAKPQDYYATIKIVSGLWSKLPSVYPFKNGSTHLLERKFRTELNSPEWSLTTIKKIAALLEQVSDEEVQEMSGMAMEQICHAMIQQKRDLSKLEKEQYDLANLSLLTLLKTVTIEQIKHLPQKEAVVSV